MVAKEDAADTLVGASGEIAAVQFVLPDLNEWFLSNSKRDRAKTDKNFKRQALNDRAHLFDICRY